MAGENGGRDESAGLIDRISELPDEIRESILGYLPIGDAIRTTVLSRKWSYSWTRARQLNIEFNGYKNQMRRNKCCRLVGRILLFHVGPIHKFVMHVSWLNRKGDMNAWVQFLSGHGIKDLSIHGGYWLDRFDVPPSIYQCSELSSLSLGRCSLLNTIAFRCFPKLVKLHLFAVIVYEDILEKIISSCPLEMLSLDTCTFYSGWNNLVPCKITISAPNLRIFDIVLCVDRISNCYLKNTPNLRAASFMMGNIYDVDYLNSNCFDLLGSMPHIESLYFDCPLHKTLASDIIPKKLPDCLVNLKTVTLNDLDVISIDQISFMFCIIRSSPNLQNSVIHMSGIYAGLREDISKDSLKTAIAYLEAMDKEEIKTGITTLSVNTGGKADLEDIEAVIALIGSVVSCCPSLEKLCIKAPSSIKGPAKLHLSRALRRFGRSPSKPKIIYTKGYH